MWPGSRRAIAALFRCGVVFLPFGAAAAERVVAFAQDTLANDWRAAQVRGLEKAFAPVPGVRFVYSDAKGSTAGQVQAIEDFADQGVDLLITSPRDGAAMTAPIAAVHRRGIPVLLLTRHILTNDFTAFVGPDDRAIARRAVLFLAGHLHGRGRVLVLQGVPSATTAIQRTEGFLEGLRDHPGVQVVAIRPANYLRLEAARVVEGAVEEGLRFDAIFAQSDSMAVGARLALEKAGIAPSSVPLVGIDYIQEAREAIRSGRQLASFTYPTCAAEGARVALELLAGRSVPREVLVESQLVTRDNVEEVAPIF